MCIVKITTLYMYMINLKALQIFRIRFKKIKKKTRMSTNTLKTFLYTIALSEELETRKLWFSIEIQIAVCLREIDACQLHGLCTVSIAGAYNERLVMFTGILYQYFFGYMYHIVTVNVADYDCKCPVRFVRFTLRQ